MNAAKAPGVEHKWSTYTIYYANELSTSVIEGYWLLSVQDIYSMCQLKIFQITRSIFNKPIRIMNGTYQTKITESCYILKENIEVVIRFPSTWSFILYVVAFLINVSLVFSTLFLNGVAVVTIWNSSTLNKRVSFFTILIQSIVDLANGVTVMPLSTIHFFRDLIGSPSCILAYIGRKIGFLLFFFSMTTMSAMSFERYMGVLHPFVHHVHVTKARLMKYVISVCSLQAFLYSLTFIYGAQTTRMFFVVNMFLFLAFIAFAYTRIFCHHVKKNRIQPEQSVTNVAKRQSIKESKIAKSCFLVVATSLVCWLPSITIVAVLNLEKSFLVITIQKCFYILNMLNSTGNALIYFWWNKALRKEGQTYIRDLLNKMFAKSLVEPSGKNDSELQ